MSRYIGNKYTKKIKITYNFEAGSISYSEPHIELMLVKPAYITKIVGLFCTLLHLLHFLALIKS